jgi:mono/diheme cytochrome c family protein
MKRTIISLTVIIVSLLFFVSCYYDNEEALYPQLSTSCDTTNVTYSGTIVSVLNNNCYSCHSNKTAAGYGNNIRLENYSDVVGNIDRVLGSVKHSAGFSAMPKNGGSIKSCSIDQLDIWVRNRMPNN